MELLRILDALMTKLPTPVILDSTWLETKNGLAKTSTGKSQGGMVQNHTAKVSNNYDSSAAFYKLKFTASSFLASAT